MRRYLVAISAIAASVILFACSSEQQQDSGGWHGWKNQERSRSNTSGKPSQEMVEALKGQTLSYRNDVTIGDAFGKYQHFDKSAWKETKSANGNVYVDFTGWLKAAGVDMEASSSKQQALVGVEAKFVIYPDGSYALVMISKVEVGANGKMTVIPVKDQEPVLAAIYQNKEMRL